MQKNKYYKSRIAELEVEKGNSKKKSNIYSVTRLVFFIILTILNIYAFNYVFLIGLVLLPISIILFGLLVKYHNKKEEELNKFAQLISIYKNEIRNIKSENIFGNGSQYIDHKHLYTSDLDVFGKFSLYNLINRTITKNGSNILAKWLKQSSTKNEIAQRQNTVKELAKKTTFKEEFLRTFFYSKNNTNKNTSDLKEWIENFEPYFTNKKTLIIYSWVSPIIILISFAIGYIYPLIWILTFIFISVNFIVLTGQQIKVNKIDIHLGKQADIFKRFSKLVSLIKNEDFKSDLANRLKTELIGKYNPEKEFKKMAFISKRFDNRTNIFYRLLILPIFMNDIHMSVSAEKWFVENKKHINNWLEIIGEFDALLSLSILYFNNNDWIFPEIVDADFLIDAKELAHPLIPKETSITNSYNISGKAKADIITGSNMAGKSTFLRTIAVNMILAYAGAPVNAKSFKLSQIRILTYFRIHDSLEESTSSFYAELKRIRDILNIIKTNDNCLLLLDELLRGTNTTDRNLGSVAIIKQFLKYNAVGIVATHDLSIADMIKQFPEQVRNFNFDVNVKNDELFFDYKLKEGVCNSFNATLLMKKIGIDFDL